MKCLLGKHSKRMKLFEYSNLYLCLFFHYIIQGPLCSQRDHGKVTLKTQVSRVTLQVLSQVGLRTRLWPPNMQFAFTMSHNTTGGGVEVLRWYAPFPTS